MATAGEAAEPDNDDRPTFQPAGPDTDTRVAPPPGPDTDDLPTFQPAGPDTDTRVAPPPGPDNDRPTFQPVGPDTDTRVAPPPGPDNDLPTFQPAGPDTDTRVAPPPGPDNDRPTFQPAGPAVPGMGGLYELKTRRSFTRHRWLVMVQGLGSGMLSLLFLYGVFKTMQSGGDFCLLFLLVIILGLAGFVFFSITFITATFLGLKGKDKPLGRRLMGILPILSILVGVLIIPRVVEGVNYIWLDYGALIFWGSFWLGVAFINLNASLEIPASHNFHLILCISTSFLPPLAVIIAFALTGLGYQFYLSLIGAPLVALVSAVLIFYWMGMVMEQYPTPDHPVQPSWYYPK